MNQGVLCSTFQVVAQIRIDDLLPSALRDVPKHLAYGHLGIQLRPEPILVTSMSGSKMGPITRTTAIWTTRSRMGGMPSGRCPPLLFGIHTLSKGCGR